MKIIEPTVEKKDELLKCGDIVVTNFNEYRFVAQLTNKQYVLTDLKGTYANGSFDSLRQLTNATLNSSWVKAIYRSSEYELHIVPKQK